MNKVVKVKREVLQKIVQELQKKPSSISNIANTLKIGWKTCEQYLITLKDLGLAYEMPMKKERIFYLRQRYTGPAITLMSKFRAPDDIVVLNEPKPRPEEICDLT